MVEAGTTGEEWRWCNGIGQWPEVQQAAARAEITAAANGAYSRATASMQKAARMRVALRVLWIRKTSDLLRNMIRQEWAGGCAIQRGLHRAVRLTL